jgi:hypothetical protein
MLEGFAERFELWEKNERCPGDLGLTVLAWTMNRHTDPYKGMRREPDQPNLWFGEIPGTEHEGLVVCCSYWIYESQHLIRCNLFSSLSSPV